MWSGWQNAEFDSNCYSAVSNVINIIVLLGQTAPYKLSIELCFYLCRHLYMSETQCFKPRRNKETILKTSVSILSIFRNEAVCGVLLKVVF